MALKFPIEVESKSKSESKIRIEVEVALRGQLFPGNKFEDKKNNCEHKVAREHKDC